MGNKGSKNRVSDHVAFSTSSGPLPNIIVTTPTPLCSPDSPKPFAPPPTPREGNYHYPDSPPHNAPPPTPRAERETMILAGTPPPDRPPPPPPVEEPFSYQNGSYYEENTIKNSMDSLDQSPPLPPTPAPRAPLPVIKRNIVYAKDRIAQFEALNTTERAKEGSPKDHNSKDYQSIKDYSTSRETKRFQPFSYTPLTESSTLTSKSMYDEYPIYNPVSDYTFKSGMTFQQGAFPIDVNRVNIGFCGRQGAGKSTLINALRGLSLGDPQTAGRNPCDNMEPFRFIEDTLQNIILWEIPYPRTFTNVIDIYDRNMGFDRFYESHKLNLFHRLFVLIPDGAPHDDDVSFSKVVHSRRTPLTLLSTKTDDDLDAESRETGRMVGEVLKKEYDSRARNVFTKSLMTKAQILASTELLLISSPTVRNLVSGTTGYLHYKMDEERLLDLVNIQAGCHYALENKLRKEREEIEGVARPTRLDRAIDDLHKKVEATRTRDTSPSLRGFPPKHIQKSTVLADAGFEIFYGTDDRVFGNLEPKSMVRRAGRTAFNYGFIGGTGVGKSTMINAMRGMSSKHPLAAGKSKAKKGSCDRFEFDDDLLKYSVTLWELHYPKKINAYFEFIDRHNISNFTAIFVLIDGIPSDEDLSFSKIAYRRNASVVFLSSKSDQKLSSRSRSDEIPVCDLLKQRFVDKGMARFDRALASSAPELCGRVHAFFVSAPVFRALRIGDARGMQFILHERAVFDFLKQKRIIADLLDSPEELKEGLYANVNMDTAGVAIEDSS